MTRLPVLGADEKLAEIRRLYFATTRQTIGDDLPRAVQLLKSMNSEEERERARVYMDGLAQMRSDWARQSGRGKGQAKPSGSKPDSGGADGANEHAARGKRGRHRRPKGPHGGRR
jgi:hypothetical protein